jgi:hypothetical protein
LSAISYDSYFSEFSSQSISPLVGEVVMRMQCSSDSTPLLGGYVPSEHVVSHPIQPVVEEVFVLMKSSSNPTLLLESFDSTKLITPM